MPYAPEPRPAEGSQIYDFRRLMARRVENIILVSSTYDTFILQEDGLLSELLLEEFLSLHLHHTTDLTHVSSSAEAIALATTDDRFNLIICALDPGDMNATELARRVKEAGLNIPVVLLAFDGGELARFMANHDTSGLERIFLWQGDPRILLAITKYVEDKLNVAFDTGVAGVQVILLIEDNIRYYSSFLPMIYTEIINHSQSLITEGLNRAHKILRMRARPKILLCTSFEEAWDYFSAYQEDVLGVISDVEFPRGGDLDPQAGAEFARRVGQAWYDIPVLLQSSRPECEADARAVGAEFLLKGSPTLLDGLRRFMVDNFFFGDFVFRLPDGTPLGRAKTLKSLLEMLGTVPAESIAYHAERNHFSRWLKARTEFQLAQHLRPLRTADFDTIEDRRRYLIQAIETHRHERAREAVSDFDAATFDPEYSFARIGGGSLGGKARGLAFMRHLLRDLGVIDQFAGLRITVPSAVTLTTDVFDRFLRDGDLRSWAMQTEQDDEVERRFAAAALPAEVESSLATYLELARYPLAVRSSSLLEDSPNLPLAGVYKTVMLPNDHADPAVRLRQLQTAVKRVFASTFSTQAKDYFKATPYRLEEEKMAVIIQRLVGSRHETRFYPHVAGVARSHNYYPLPPLSAEDGVVAVALGLGRTVVDGGSSLSFCPKFPRHLVQFSTVEDMLANSQRDFLALEMDAQSEPTEGHHPLATAESDGTLAMVASTYSPENDAVYDGISFPGPRLVSFAPLLKPADSTFPAALRQLMELGRRGMNTDVEIEFAVNLSGMTETPSDFGFLQIRPLALAAEVGDRDLADFDADSVLVRSDSVLGNGRLTDIRDVVVVDRARFDRAKSREIAAEVARINAALTVEGTSYVLMGLGRWGSADPWLGIPVTWEQISGARVIVESGLEDIKVAPSQGSHFFQNLTCFGVAYFTVDPDDAKTSVDWEWLATQPAAQEGPYVRHLRFSKPLLVLIDGRRHAGLMLKPGVA